MTRLPALLLCLLLAAPAAAAPAPLGASFPCNKGDLADPGPRLAKMQEAGFGFVSFIPNYTYQHLDEIDFSEAPAEEELSAAVALALKRGLGVVLKPHLEPAMYQRGFGMFTDGNHSWRARTGWRGFFDIDPMAPDYRERLVFTQLRLLKKAFEGLDGKRPPASVRLELGTELMNSVVYKPGRWLELLKAAKAERSRLGLDGKVLLSHNFCHHFEIPEDFVLRLDAPGRAALAAYIKGLDAFAVSQYMDLTAAMPAPERGRRDPTVQEIAAALRLHEKNMMEKVLGGALGLKPAEIPPFHVGEFGVGRGGLAHPNLWEGAATPEEDAALRRQIALGHRGLLEYLRGGGRSAGSATLWLTGRYYDIFGWMNPADRVDEAARAVETALAADRALGEAPADFDEFWRKTLAELEAVPADLKLEPAPAASDDKVKCWKASYNGWAARRVYAWYCRPADERRSPGLLISPWYGQGAVQPPSAQARRGLAALAWQGRGYEVDLASYPAANSGYALEGMDSPYTHAYRGLYANAARGLAVLASLPGVDTDRLGAAGASQGGGLSLAAAGLDPRVGAASADFPFMTGLARGFHLSEGTVKGMRELAEREPARRAAVLDTARYFDTAHFAPRIKAAVKMQAGLKDRSCPPEGIAAVYEALNSPKQYEEFPGAGHSDQSSLRWEKALDFVYSALATE